MTDESSEFDWKSVFSERGHDAEPVGAPSGREDDATALEWFQLITRFTQRGFLRVIAAQSNDEVKVELQVALPGGDDVGYLAALRSHLEATGVSLELISEERPWTLDLVVDSEAELRSLVEDLELLSEHVRLAEDSTELGTLVQAWSTDEDKDQPESSEDEPEETAEDANNADASASASPFETIGDDEADPDAAPPQDSEDDSSDSESASETARARLASFSLRVASPAIVLTAQADSDSDEGQLERLGRSLRSKLENRFDLVARSTDVASDANEVSLTLEPSELGATYGMPLGDLCDDVARYLDRQRELADLGVSLDKLSGRKRAGSSSRARKPRGDAAESRMRRERRQEPKAEVEEASGVVFGFGEEDIAAASPSESTIDAGDYSDPRVMREDATTALVDVVLRHPGYSDRNMRQVLSILLDVDYYRAGKLIDQSPCVIAWGVSQERAREFKRVIEGAGGRVTLVEPDSLAEAE